MTELERLDQWLVLLRKYYPSGFVFKDLTVSTPDWSVLAVTTEPLLLLVDAAEISRTIEHLVNAGMSPALHCAVLRDAPVLATAGTVALKSRGFPETVQLLLLAEDVAPLQGRRLAGKTVLITRAQRQAGRLRELLELEGARVLEAPAIEIVEKPEQIAELKEALRNLDRYSWLVLTSANTVAIVDSVLKSISADWKLLEPLHTACIGTATAARVHESGGKVDLVPPKFQAESLAEELLKHPIAGKQILLPRAEGSRRILVEELQQHNAAVHEITVYRAEIPVGGHEELQRLLQEENVDFITFTSSSTVHHFVEMAGDLLTLLKPQKTRIAAIGPITAATLRDYGLTVAAEATEFTIPGLVEAMATA